jgi:hypothetical protein
LRDPAGRQIRTPVGLRPPFVAHPAILPHPDRRALLILFAAQQLLEIFRPEDVQAGIREAIARGAIGFDAVKHLVLCRIERRPPRLDLTVYPYLPRASVAMTSAKAYLDLLTGASP